MKKKAFYSVIISMILVLASAAAVFADTIPEGKYRFKNVLSGLYLESSGYSQGSNILQRKVDYTLQPQSFVVLKSSNGYYTIHAAADQNLVLDVDGASAENNANVQLYTANGTAAQQWKFLSNNNGSFRVMSKCSQDTKGLTVLSASLSSGANIIQHEYNATKNDMWLMEANLDRGVYMVRNKQTGLYLTFEEVGIARGTAKLDTSGKGQRQQFYISEDSNGYFDIAPNVDRNLSLYVPSNQNNATVIFDLGAHGEGQSWKFVLNDDGTYRIVSDISYDKKALTVRGTTTSNLYSCEYDINANNRWELIRVSN